MLEVFPTLVDGAVVCNVGGSCRGPSVGCDDCAELAVIMHNWIKQTDLRYLVLDLQDEKDICATFLEEILQLRKRLRHPFLFAGVMDRPLRILEKFNYGASYPLFITPEDAVRALRLQYPGITETEYKLEPLLDVSLRLAFARLPTEVEEAVGEEHVTALSSDLAVAEDSDDPSTCNSPKESSDTAAL